MQRQQQQGNNTADNSTCAIELTNKQNRGYTAGGRKRLAGQLATANTPKGQTATSNYSAIFTIVSHWMHDCLTDWLYIISVCRCAYARVNSSPKRCCYISFRLKLQALQRTPAVPSPPSLHTSHFCPSKFNANSSFLLLYFIYRHFAILLTSFQQTVCLFIC